MGLADLFRPKWKHSNPSVRSAAVRQLAAEEVSALGAVARQDADPAIRRIAVKKLDDPEILAEVAAQDGDESVRQLAAERLSSMRAAAAMGGDVESALRALGQIKDAKVLAEVAKNATPERVWQRALERIQDPKVLADVARSAGNKDVRLAALTQISDAATLRAIAIDDDRREMAQNALDRLDDVDALEEVAKKGKSKAVRARAKKRAQALRAPSEEEQEALREQQRRNAKRTQLCRGAEELARGKDFDKATLELAALQSEWDAIEGPVDAELGKRFERACERFIARKQALEAHEAQRELGEQERRRREREEEERQEEERRQREEEAGLRRAEERMSVEDRARQQEERRQRLVEFCERAEAAVKEDDLAAARAGFGTVERDLRRVRRALDADAELSARFAAAQQQLEGRLATEEAEREAQAQENADHLVKICERLEALCQSDSHRDVENAMNEGQKAFRSIGSLPTRQQRDELKHRYEEVRKKLFIHLQELREAEEWKRWSNVGRKEELCRVAEALKDEKDLKTVAQTLRELQSQWKKQGPVSRERADDLWVRFKTACDLAYARCEGYFSQLDEERQENLRKKEELCTQVGVLSDSEDWEQTAEQIKELQSEWKKIGPVPKEQSDEIWKRFRTACDLFFERRKDHYDELNNERKENLKRKQELCDEVEELAESNDWQVTTEKIKALQSMWKKIGPVPRKKSDAVWKRFRAACDRFFERREDEREGEHMVAYREREALCAELEALAGKTAPPAASAEPSARLAGPAGPAEAAESPTDEQAAAPEPPAEASPTDDAPKPTPAQQAKKVLDAQQRWRRMGRVPRKYEDASNARFKAACEAVVLAHPEAFANTDLDPAVSKRRREKICARLETLVEECPDSPRPRKGAGGSSSDEVVDPKEAAEKLRAALAANALGGTARLWSWHEVDAELEQLREDWQRLGPVPGADGEALGVRLETALRELGARRPREDRSDRRGERPRGERRDGPRRDEPGGDERSRRQRRAPRSAGTASGEGSSSAGEGSSSAGESSAASEPAAASDAPATSPTEAAASEPAAASDAPATSPTEAAASEPAAAGDAPTVPASEPAPASAEKAPDA